MEVKDKFERSMSISHSIAADESKLPDCDDVSSLTTSDPASSVLLASSHDKQNKADENNDASERSQPTCPAYDELMDVMSHASARSAMEM